MSSLLSASTRATTSRPRSVSVVSMRDHAVAQRIVDGAGVGRQRQLDHRLVGGGRRFELGQPRGARLLQSLPVIAERLVEAGGRLGEPIAMVGEALVEAGAVLFEPLVEMRLVLVEALVEFGLAAVHHRVDRLDLADERLAEPLGMSGDALDRAFAAFADQCVEGAELFLDATGLVVEVGDQGAAARAQRVLETGDGRGERVVHAVAANGDRRHRLAGGGGELLADFAGFVAPALERGAGGRFQPLLRGDGLGGDRVGGAARRVSRTGRRSRRPNSSISPRNCAWRASKCSDQAAPAEFEQRARVVGLARQRRFEPRVGGDERILERLAAHHDQFMQPVDREVEPRRQPFAVVDDDVGNAARARTRRARSARRCAGRIRAPAISLATARRVATASPCRRIASAACAPLSAMRPTTTWSCSSSAWPAAACRRR